MPQRDPTIPKMIKRTMPKATFSSPPTEIPTAARTAKIIINIISFSILPTYAVLSIFL